MNIYDILKQEHNAVKKLMKEAKEANGVERDDLVRQIIDELTAHAAAEEEVFYDRVAEADELHDLIGEAEEEHLSVARLMDDLLNGELDDDKIEAKIAVLSEQLDHHIEEEEEEMFKKAQRILDDDVAEAIGGEFLARRAELEQQPLEERVEEALAKGEGPADDLEEPVAAAANAEEEERTAERG